MTDPLVIDIPRILVGNGIGVRAYEAVVESQEELKIVF